MKTVASSTFALMEDLRNSSVALAPFLIRKIADAIARKEQNVFPHKNDYNCWVVVEMKFTSKKTNFIFCERKIIIE